MSLQEFTSTFRNVGVANPALYRVSIGGKTVNNYFKSSVDQSLLQLYCEMAELPGMQIQTAPSKSSSGYTKETPYDVQYDHLNLTFMVDSNMVIRNFFDVWMNEIYRGIVDTETQLSLDNDATLIPYSYGFFEDYVGDIYIEQLDKSGEVTYTMKIVEAFPTILSPMLLSADNGSTYHRLNITFAYTRYTVPQTFKPKQTVFQYDGRNDTYRNYEFDKITGILIDKAADKLPPQFGPISRQVLGSL